MKKKNLELKRVQALRKAKRHNSEDFFNRIAIGFPRTAVLREVMNWKDSGPKSARRLLP